MNLKSFFVSIFTSNRSEAGMSAVRQAGREDGRELAAAYSNEFLAGAAEVLNERLKAFKAVEATPIETGDEDRAASPGKNAQDNPLRIGVKNPARRRAATVK